MRVIAYSTEGGELAVVRPAPGAQRPGETDEAFLERVRAKAVPKDARNVTLLEEADLPSDRTERAAWKLDARRRRILVRRARATEAKPIADTP